MHATTCSELRHPDRAVFGERTGVHRPFFRGGVAVLLTAGAVWGAVLLLRVAVAGSFTAISIHDVNAHGHAQIFGWVGLFVMGFSYQMFVHRRHATAMERRVAAVSLGLMLTGIVLRVVGEPLHEVPGLRALALAGACGEVVAIGLFAAVVLRALAPPERVIPAERPYVRAAVALFFLQAVYEAVLLAATTGASSHEQLLAVISTWQAPLRDIQIHGFALLMILGVGLWFFPRTFGLARPGRRERSVKFVRGACAWLVVSLALLVLAPVYVFVLLPAVGTSSAGGLHALEIGFSHAYYGAARHAITVGFISLTIMGVSARIVPLLGGLATRGLPPLWLPFVLINVGCALRVTLQIATDVVDPAFAVVGASGILEVAGFSIWGAHLWRVMGSRRVVVEPGSTTLPALHVVD